MAKDKNATKEPGRISQIRQAYTAIKGLDPRLGWWMLLAGVVTALVVMGIAWLWLGTSWWLLYAALVALMMAVLAAVIVMNRRGNTAMYRQLDGQPGATAAALDGLGKRGWYASTEPVAVDAQRGTKMSDLTGAAIVFRALGRPGVVLIGEGPKGRVHKLLKAEEKKVARVAPGVPVHRWVVGDGDDEVQIRKLRNKLVRMRPVLTKEETSTVNKRLRSLGGIRTGVPAGMDPTRVRPDRRALRGK